MVKSKKKVDSRAVSARNPRLIKYICEECGEEVKAIKGSICYHCHKRHVARMEKR